MEDFVQFFMPLITALGIIGLIVGVAYFQSIIKKLTLKINDLEFIRDNGMSEYINIVLLELINGTVDDVIKLILKRYQEDEDKIITKEDIPEIIEIASGMIKNNLSETQEKIINKAFGDLDKWLASKIEETVVKRIET